MDQSFPTRAPDSAEAVARLESWIPPDWILLASLRDADPGCHVLVHPRHGAILLDLAPGGTPAAEARLGRSLAMASFGQGLQAQLPFWYVQLELTQLPRFAALLREALSAAPNRQRPAKGSWIATLRAALGADPAWIVEAPPQESPMPSPRPIPRPRSRGRLRRGALVALGLGVTFLLGLTLGQLGRPPEPVAPPLAEAAESSGPTTPPPARTVEGTDAAGTDAPELAAAPAPPQDDPPEPMEPIAAPPPAAAAVQEDPLPEVALPPPPATVARPRTSARAPAGSPDRRCAEAQFRWQQGGHLSWAEMAYVREGCWTGRYR